MSVASLSLHGSFQGEFTLLVTPMSNESDAKTASESALSTKLGNVTTIIFKGERYTRGEDVSRYMGRVDPREVFDTPVDRSCCPCLCSCLKAIGIALLILGGVATMAAGVGLALATFNISILGSATLAAPVITYLGVKLAYFASAVAVVIGFAGFILGNVNCCKTGRDGYPD